MSTTAAPDEQQQVKEGKRGAKATAPAAATSAPPVFVFHGDKGGVGKSMTCSLVTDWLMSRGVKVAVVDGDARNPDVARMFAQTVDTSRANLREREGWMDMTDFMLQHKDSVVALSLPAGVGTELEQEGKRFVNALAMLNRPLVLFWVMDTGSDVVALLDQALDVLGGRVAAKVAVQNLYHSERPQMFEWFRSEARARFEASGGKTISIGKLHPRVRAKVFASTVSGTPFSLGVTDINDAESSAFGLTASENMELALWLQEAGETFDQLRPVLGI